MAEKVICLLIQIHNMPTDNVINRDFYDLFTAQVRYEIPFFQRGYAWEQRQWKKLFEDIETEVIESVLDGKFEEEEHFFGPIVVHEKISTHPNLKRFLVIDGQQRITTIYLLLAIIKRNLDAKGHLSQDAQKISAEIEELLSNKVSGSDDYLKLKVFSSKGDRYPTYKGVFGDNPSSPFLGDDQLLYNPDDNKVDQFIAFASRKIRGYDVPQLNNLFQAITKSLKIVWIPLSEKDDAQAIFESLNDAGMPLSASELLCNYIFKPLTDDQTNRHEKLHNEKWLKARRIVSEPHFEDYLRAIFSIGENKRVGKDRRMYVHFKVKNKKLTADSAINALEKILDYTTPYNQVTQPIRYPHTSSRIKELLIKISCTNMSSINPFLIALLKSLETGKIDDKDVEKLLQETYILLVRRKICTLSVTKYDTFFPPLLEKIILEPNKIKAYHSQIQKENLWVSDQQFEEAFISKEIYNGKELNFSRLVLQEIDRELQKFGELPDYTTLETVEHIMPQKLDENWIQYLGQDAQDNRLPVLINTAGNLCLNSQKANSTFGQKLFEDKKGLYNNISALARDVKTRNVIWNLKAIQDRSRDLSKSALEVWKWGATN